MQMYQLPHSSKYAITLFISADIMASYAPRKVKKALTVTRYEKYKYYELTDIFAVNCLFPVAFHI